MTNQTDERSQLEALVAEAAGHLEGDDPTAAEQACRKGLSINPTHSGLRCQLGVALTLQGKLVKASQQLRRVVNQDPQYGRGHEELGKTLLAMHKAAEAVQHLQRAIELEPDRIPTRVQLAGTLFSLRRHKKAGEVCQQLLDNDAIGVDVFLLLGNAAARTQAYEEAIPLLQRAVELAPDRADSWRLLGETRANLGNSGQAISAYETGLQLEPDNGPLLSLLGNELRIVGRRDEAIETYEKCIAIYPTVGEVYFSLANLKAYTFSDALIAQMEEQAQDESLPDEARASFHFALGRAYEDRSNFEKAFGNFRLGNAIRRRSEKYDADLADRVFEQIAAVFTRDLIDSNNVEHDNDTPTPIFIVGMPRAGSTLLEQILASHSQVEGTHELPDLGRVVQRLDVPRPNNTPFPQAYSDLPVDLLRQLGQQYLDATQKYRSGLPYFVDKMPNNFSFIGALRMILPHAKVIDARRDPLDTCMSVYKQLFYGVQSYSYSFSELARYYLNYQKLMDHWQNTIAGFVLRVDYEDLVKDQEQQTRRLLEFCGLEFEESCLRFHETGRAIATASSEQVRQPIYTGAIGSWRHYEPYIGELIDDLQAADG